MGGKRKGTVIAAGGFLVPTQRLVLLVGFLLYRGFLSPPMAHA